MLVCQSGSEGESGQSFSFSQDSEGLYYYKQQLVTSLGQATDMKHTRTLRTVISIV